LALYYNSPREIDKFLFGSVPLFRFSADLSWLAGHAFALNPHAAGGAVVSMVRWWWWSCYSIWWWQVYYIPPPITRIPRFLVPAFSRLLSLCCDSIYLCFNRCGSFFLSSHPFILASKNTHNVVTNICCIESIDTQFFLCNNNVMQDSFLKGFKRILRV